MAERPDCPGRKRQSGARFEHGGEPAAPASRDPTICHRRAGSVQSRGSGNHDGSADDHWVTGRDHPKARGTDDAHRSLLEEDVDMADDAARPTPACASVQEVVSARLDHEDARVEVTRAGPEGSADRVVDVRGRAVSVADHLASCTSCRAFRAEAAELHRRVRVAPAPSVPDLQDRIVAAMEVTVPEPTRPVSVLRRREARVVLGMAGAVQVLVAVVGLVGAAPLHAVREVAAFEVALGVAMVVAAWRPGRFAHGMLPVVAFAAAIVLGAAVVDVVEGVARPIAEFSHLVPAIGAIVLWWLDRHPAAPGLRVHSGTT